MNPLGNSGKYSFSCNTRYEQEGLDSLELCSGVIAIRVYRIE